MAIFKCKMCGGELSFTPGDSTGVCDYCGAEQTLPKVMDDNLQGLFNRANVLRMKAEFDKATEIYEKILQASGTEAEAYWGLILCKYGIEYVEDPATYKRVPTCHRASFDAVTVDDDYKMAIQYADITQKALYEEQAKQIDEIQKGIIALAQNEEPYDVFICYKETDESGQRTVDSVIANDIYHQLTQEGFKVFYAAITLEDKLGQEYEPYIFSALNSARVMLSIGTKPEYFNAVWVKNEWSRFLKIMKKDRARMLIPCYKDMDAYELPEEFAHLQAQDMSKIGFINDIVRGIKKVIVKDEPKAAPEQVVVQQAAPVNSNVQALIKRGNMALEDGEWEKADGFFEEVLNQDAECAEAYLGKLLASHKLWNRDMLIFDYIDKYEVKGIEKQVCEVDESHISDMIDQYAIENFIFKQDIENMYTFNLKYVSEIDSVYENNNEVLEDIEADKLLSRVQKYAKGETKQWYDEFCKEVTERLNETIETTKKEESLQIEKIKKEYKQFLVQTDEKIIRLYEEKSYQREEMYQKAIASIDSATSIHECEYIIKKLDNLGNYKDKDDYIRKCKKKIAGFEKHKKKKTVVSICTIAALVLIGVVLIKVIIPYIKNNSTYKSAIEMMENEKYDEAIKLFKEVIEYSDSAAKIEEAKIKNKDYVYQKALEDFKAQKYESVLNGLSGYTDDNSDYAKNCKQLINDSKVKLGFQYFNKKDYKNAKIYFEQLTGNNETKEYLDIIDIILELEADVKNISRCYYRLKAIKNKAAQELLNNKDMKKYAQTFLGKKFAGKNEYGKKVHIEFTATNVVGDLGEGIESSNKEYGVVLRNGNYYLAVRGDLSDSDNKIASNKSNSIKIKTYGGKYFTLKKVK